MLTKGSLKGLREKPTPHTCHRSRAQSLTVFCATPLTPASGNFCTGLASCLCAPGLHTPRRTGSAEGWGPGVGCEPGWKRKEGSRHCLERAGPGSKSVWCGECSWGTVTQSHKSRQAASEAGSDRQGIYCTSGRR